MTGTSPPGSPQGPRRPAAEPETDRLRDVAARELAGAEALAGRELAAIASHPRWAATMRLVAGVAREQSAEQVGLAASGAAFWLVISACPTAIAAISLYGLVVSPSEVASDLGRLARAAPGSLGALVTQQLARVAAADHTGLSVGLGVSLLLAVWSASAGVYNLDRAIRDAYGMPRQRYVEARARALVAAFAIVVALGAVALAASVVAAHTPEVVALAIGGPAVLVGIAVAVAALYRLSVGRRVALRALLPGAVASAVGVLVLIGGFSAYVAWSTRYTAVYGAFAGAVIGLLATYLAVYVVLLGAVLNAQLEPEALPTRVRAGS